MPDSPRVVRCSSGPFSKRGYPLAKDWPADCFCQAGDRGVVFSQEGSYRTAFFEAFPADPKCFLRGEGRDVQEAEAECWKKWQKILACPGHEFERRGREDGYAYCRHCPYSSTVLEPTTHCHDCGTLAHYGRDADENILCQSCYDGLPKDRWDETRRRIEEMEKQPPPEPEDIAKGLLAMAVAVEVISEEAVQGRRTVSGVQDLTKQMEDLLATDPPD